MNPTVQVRIDIGGIDYIPHTFLYITDSNGRSYEYGFVPADGGIYGKGKVDQTGTVENPTHEYSVAGDTLQLTGDQYTSLMNIIGADTVNPPDYLLGPVLPNTSNCTTWALGVLDKLGVGDGPVTGGAGGGIYNPYQQFTNVVMRDFFRGLGWTTDNLQQEYHQAEDARSPLVLDLDGDGVETVGMDVGIHFDHDGNGFSELSGWAAPDDGILVWDKNNDGAIDTGNELFGNSSVLLDEQLAANGFWHCRNLTVTAAER
ncbi:hypothetical protein [Pseudomonas sp. F01002]|uniref:hypothetical protein n=1 Tax=Pseudomonas sp. F01002 TaxID=2555724 RepID=UPI00106CAC22|nr:hypothetical protein [Pseudomonas sp. F01002]TFB42268.1 hypothetical protein E3W21_09145 [Pseudomonas sp. F01002]